jgi:protein O-mannosyl-transferase
MQRSLMFLILLFAAFVALDTALYLGGLSAPLFYDSVQLIEKAYAFAGYDSSDLIQIAAYRRSIPTLSFYFNYLATGLDPLYYRLTNVVLHAASAVSVAVFVYLLTVIPSLRVPGTVNEKRAVAVFMGLLFLVHPLQVFFVLYVWQRMALMAGLFFFASLACYLAARTKRRPYPVLGYGASFLLFLFALASKENAIALIPTVLMIEYCIGDWRGKTTARHWRIAAGAGIALTGLLWMISHTKVGAAWTPGTIMGVAGRYYRESGLTFGEVALTQFRVWFSYLYMIVVPAPSNILLVKAVTISKSLTNPPITMAAFGGAVVLLVTGLILLRKSRLSGIGICLLLINLLPESFLVPHFQYFGYRAIVPMVGLFLVMADAILWLLNWASGTTERRKVRVATAVLLTSALIFCSIATVLKARAWHHPVVLWEQAFATSPRFGPNVEPRISREILNNLGRAVRRTGKGPEAVSYHQQALRINPGSRQTWVALGKAYLSSGDLQKAERYVRHALKIKPNDPVAQCDLARVLAGLGRNDTALVHAQKAVELSPRNAAFINALGYVHFLAGNRDKAMQSFRRALEIDPRLVEAHINFGTTLLDGGKVSQAIPYFRKALELDPNSGQAHNHLGVALAQSGDLKKAVKHFRRALVINPNDRDSRRNLEIALRELAAGSQKHR